MSTLPTLKAGQSWCCANGCGECEVEPAMFEYSRTEHPNGDVESKSQRIFVSKCCGADIDLWDEEKQGFVEWDYPEFATTEPAQEAAPMSDEEIADLVAEHDLNRGLWKGPTFSHNGIFEFARAIERRILAANKGGKHERI